MSLGTMHAEGGVEREGQEDSSLSVEPDIMT